MKKGKDSGDTDDRPSGDDLEEPERDIAVGGESVKPLD